MDFTHALFGAIDEVRMEMLGLTDGQRTHIAMNMSMFLGDAYKLYGQAFCARFEEEVLKRMKNGLMSFKDADKATWDEWQTWKSGKSPSATSPSLFSVPTPVH